MIKVLSIFGTRPEAIKMAPVVRELQRHPDTFESPICVTGQHREMLDQVLGLFDIVPDHDLNIMRPNQSLVDINCAVLRGLDPILEAEQPDWILVQGDTTTVMAAALAAFYKKIKVGHVEAGLRTWNKFHPFPEEINRHLVSVIADLHFAPTEWAAKNLRREGIPDDRIVVTGNTVVDALHYALALPFEPADSPVASVAEHNGRVILVTAHRRENFGDGIRRICDGLRQIAEEYPDTLIVYPVHPNPNIKGPVYERLSDLPNIVLLSSLDYQPMVWLLNRCDLVITDSGGLQEEAPGVAKPVLVLRDTTERPEGVDLGLVRIIGPDSQRMFDKTVQAFENPDGLHATCRYENPYGDGHASRKIVQSIAGLGL